MRGKKLTQIFVVPIYPFEILLPIGEYKKVKKKYLCAKIKNLFTEKIYWIKLLPFSKQLEHLPLYSQYKVCLYCNK